MREHQDRQPKGVPVGGQWATTPRGEAELGLVEDWGDDPWGSVPDSTGSVCPHCGGAGTWTNKRDHDRDCALCGATGRLTDRRLPVGADSGLRLEHADRPVLVTEHNADLLAHLTQEDLDSRSEAYRDACTVEEDRIVGSITAADVTLPEHPTTADIAAVAEAVDRAWAGYPGGQLDTVIGVPGWGCGPHPVLGEVYGTPDRALVAIGAAVAQRADALAEGHAHGGAEETERRWLDRVATREADHAASGAAYKQADHLDLEAARDPHTRTALADMADSYTAALAEVRPMGGDLAVHEESSRPGAAVAAATGEVWPTDWVERSNAPEVPPLHIGASTVRAHYAHQERVDFTRRGQGTAILTDFDPHERRTRYSHDAGVPHLGRVRGVTDDGHPRPTRTWHQGDRYATYATYEPLTEQEKTAAGIDPANNSYRALEWEIRDEAAVRAEYNRNLARAAHALGMDIDMSPAELEQKLADRGVPLRNQQPKEMSWELTSDPHLDDGEPFYRRPKTRAVRTGAENVSQIKLSKERAAKDPRRDSRYGAAVHEVGHRMEYLVPNLNAMTRSFRERRVAETARAEDRELVTIYRGTDEVGYKDEFTEIYAGKSYDHRERTNLFGMEAERPGTPTNFREATEVFSMGADALFGSRRGGLIGLDRTHHADPDYRHFILGVFATAGRTHR